MSPETAGGPTSRGPVSSVTAFFPCYNDVATIAGMVTTVTAALETQVEDFEVVVIDDGSTDGSVELLRRLEAELPRLAVVVHERNRGYGGALLSGFGAATKEWVFYTDGDGQYDAAEVVDLLAAVGPDTDVVQGWKIGRGDPWYRKLIGRVYHHVVKVLFGLHVRDTDCDFRLMRRSLVDKAELTQTSGTICVEMMRRFEELGARFVEVPVHHYHRPHGRSQFFRLPQIARSARQLLALWWRLVLRGATRP